MVHKFHRGFTAAEKTELWDRWKRGNSSLKAIGRAWQAASSLIYFWLHRNGLVAQRRRSRLALTLAEREVISRGVTAHRSARSIARLLGRSPSTVSREMSRNGGCDRYRATLADENAWARSRRPKCCKLANSPRLRRAVAGKLRLDWLPQQIAGWLKRTHPEDECNRVSHETIYRSLFVQTRGVLKKEELLSHLRSKRSMRRSKPVDPNGDRRGHIKDIVSIRQRPAAVEDRAVPGHWEGDLLSGPNNSYIATLVERHTRYVMLAKVAGKDTQTVVFALIKRAKKRPKELYKSLTWDRGKELTDHRRFMLATRIDVILFATAKPMAARIEGGHQSPAETVLSKRHRLVGALASPSEQSGSWLNERPRETSQFETLEQRDLTPVLRRSVEPAPDERTFSVSVGMSQRCQSRKSRTRDPPSTGLAQPRVDLITKQGEVDGLGQ